MTNVVYTSWRLTELDFYDIFLVSRRGTIFLPIWETERRAHFIANLRRVTPFYCVNFGGGWWSLFIYVQKYAGCRLEFQVMVKASRLDQVI